MNTAPRLVVRAAVAVALVAAVAVGCADAPVQAPVAPARPSPAGNAPIADQHAADVTYAQAMVSHVVQGLELTAMVPGRASDPDLPRLVLLMDNADVEEQGQLAGWLHLQHAPVPGEAGVPLARMPGMADEATLQWLRGLSGPAFDRAWIDVMTAHHGGGVDMSRAYLASSRGPALASLAEAQVEVGIRQIGQMQDMRVRS